MIARVTDPVSDLSPFCLSNPENLTDSNILKLDENACGIVLISKFAHLSYNGALAIESGNIRSLLQNLAITLESSFFFRYRVVERDSEATMLRDTLRSIIGVRKLGE